MSSEEAKRQVQEGLQRKRIQRKEAEKEARLEQYEQDQIKACNVNCADAKLQRKLEETGRLNREQAEERRRARQEAMRQEAIREDKAVHAARYYGLACLWILWLTAVTHLPVWAAFALIISTGIFPVIYIFRLYYPIER